MISMLYNFTFLATFISIFTLWQSTTICEVTYVQTWDKHGTRYTLVEDNDEALNLLCIPGGPGADSQYFLPLVEGQHLPGKVWLIDFPGNGTNIEQNVETPFDDWPHCLLAAVGRFKNPILITHSFGGMLALLIPQLEELLKGLIIIASSPIFDAQEIANMLQERNIVIPPEPGQRFREQPTVENFRSLLFAIAPRHFPFSSLDAGRAMFMRLPFNFQALLWGNTKIINYQAQWIPQYLPTLIIGGSEDCVNPISLFQRDQRFKRHNIILHVLQGSGHFPWFENQDAIIYLIKAFIENL